jgi:hypothetical protein
VAQQEAELRTVERQHKQTLESLTAENDKILSSSLQEQIRVEREKLETIYKASIQASQRQHEETLAMLKTQL